MIVYALFLIVGIALILRNVKYFHISGINPWWISGGFLIKIVAGFAFLYIYSYHYSDGSLTDDAGVYMEESKILHDVASQSFDDYLKLIFEFGDEEKLQHQYLQKTKHWDAGEQAILNDAKNMLKLHSIIQFISFGSPIIHMIIMCLFGLIGTIYLIKATLALSIVKEKFIFLGFLLFPSLLFWSSGIVKEPLMLLGMGFTLYGLIANLGLIKRIWFVLIGAMLLIMFKSYLLILLIPILLFLQLYSILPKHKILGALSILFGVSMVITIVFQEQRDDFIHLLSRKQFDFKNVARGGIHLDTKDHFYYITPENVSNVKVEGDSARIIKETKAMILQHGQMADPVPVVLKPSESKMLISFQNRPAKGYIELTPIRNSFSQLLLNIPEALINVFFRPFPWDPGSKMKYPAILELIGMLGLMAITIWKRKRITDKHRVILVSFLIYSLSLALLIGWTTPVLGAIVRYRIPILVLLLFSTIICIDTPKFLRK